MIASTAAHHLPRFLQRGSATDTDTEGSLNMTDSSKTVLLVEDNEDNRTVYRTILEHFGYRVTEARNGEDGVRMAREDHPDLILMDISIPLIDGWEATRILKSDAGTSDIPIIALTAHALATDRAKAQEVGCDGYLAKPCEPRRVVAEVERFIGAGREARA
jgi:CheY-like chemotaxis protein